jgi:hypothetical protein
LGFPIHYRHPNEKPATCNNERIVRSILLFGIIVRAMKACAYCGRDNDDAAVICMECATGEFKAVQEVHAQELRAKGSGLGSRGTNILSGICGAISLVAMAGFGLHVFPTPIAISLGSSVQEIMLAGFTIKSRG